VGAPARSQKAHYRPAAARCQADVETVAPIRQPKGHLKMAPDL